MPDPTPASAKKRKTQPKISVSDLFPLTPEVDIIVRSRSAAYVELFGTSKIFLQAASSVFRDTLLIGSPTETHESIPIIDIGESRMDVAIFLFHLHPGKLTPSNAECAQAGRVGTSRLERLAKMAIKYDAPLVLHSLLGTYLPVLYEPGRGYRTDPINAFGLALVFNAFVHARAALRSLDACKLEPDESSDEEDVEESNEKQLSVPQAREFNLSHMDRDILGQLSVHHIAEFSRVAGKIGPDFTWVDAAKDFKVRTDPGPSSRSRSSAMLTVFARPLTSPQMTED